MPAEGVAEATPETSGDANKTTNGKLEKAKGCDPWQYYLSAIVAILAGLGTFVLIWRNSRPDQDIELARMGLNMIAVALIVEAVLICCILRVDIEQYGAIYAAIAGYVLGSLGLKQSKQPNGVVNGNRTEGGSIEGGGTASDRAASNP